MRNIKMLGFACCAMILAVSCSKEDVVGENQQLITFGDAYVDSSVRSIDPSYNNDKNLVNGFTVWGKVTGSNGNTVALYDQDGATVSRNDAEYGDAWSCNKPRYWVPKANYSFVAIVGATATAEGGMPTSLAYTADGTTDVLYGEQTATTKGVDVFAISKPVAFSMNHLLSKVKFTVKNGFATTDDVHIQVSNIKVTNAPASGTYSIADKKWTAVTATPFETLFGNAVVKDATAEQTDSVTLAPVEATESHYERLVIPSKQNWSVAFDVAMLKKATDGTDKIVYTKTYEAVSEEVELEAGRSYNFNVEVKAPDGLQAIAFGITVTDWDDSTGEEELDPNA